MLLSSVQLSFGTLLFFSGSAVFALPPMIRRMADLAPPYGNFDNEGPLKNNYAVIDEGERDLFPSLLEPYPVEPEWLAQGVLPVEGGYDTRPTKRDLEWLEKNVYVPHVMERTDRKGKHSKMSPTDFPATKRGQKEQAFVLENHSDPRFG